MYSWLRKPIVSDFHCNNSVILVYHKPFGNTTKKIGYFFLMYMKNSGILGWEILEYVQKWKGEYNWELLEIAILFQSISIDEKKKAGAFYH